MRRLVPSLEVVALSAVILCFCLPLFAGLGASDLGNDEAIYSYAVDRIIETGDWLLPRSIPDDFPFLEKPPLKFWMVAAPIAAGVLPHDEFGLRFVDALFGGAAFVYVFLLGRALAGPVCGLTAVLVLFSLPSLIFEHGLRSNNMEASLVLSYCGGLYHFAQWARIGGTRERAGERLAGHALAVSAYFILGFMTKFVAALFLPIICLGALLVSPGGWQHLCSAWRQWVVPGTVALLLCAPWFLYQTQQFGSHFWRVIAGSHVITRMTGALDPQHLQPWNAYVVWTWRDFAAAGIAWFGVAGLLRLMVGAWRGQPRLARMLLLWWLLPIALISLGTSKLFHYAYPFLPPLALGIGWVVADVARAIDRGLATWLIGRVSRLAAPLRVASLSSSIAWRASRMLLIAIALLSIALAIWTMWTGEVTWHAHGLTLFRNSSIVRPLLIAAALVVVAGYWQWAVRLGVAASLVVLLPVGSYHATVARLVRVDHPLRALSDCAVEVQRSGVPVGTGFYNAASLIADHPYYYYLRRVGPWLLTDRPTDEELRRRLFVNGAQTPIVMSRKAYELLTLTVSTLWTQSQRETSGVTGSPVSAPRPLLTGVAPDETAVVLLPGPYRTCTAPAVAAGGEEVDDHPQQRPRWR
jgi:4-amino-4-deoxy-L-arabinose transferase-like glycosyltransferase